MVAALTYPNELPHFVANQPAIYPESQKELSASVGETREAYLQVLYNQQNTILIQRWSAKSDVGTIRSGVRGVVPAPAECPIVIGNRGSFSSSTF